MMGELEQGRMSELVRRNRDMGEWIQEGARLLVSYTGTAAGGVRALHRMGMLKVKVIAFLSLFGQHLGGEPAKWADSHLQ